MFTMDFGLKAALLITFFKCLFIPTYRSTDFEVHRNWMAVTYSLPVRQWYTEDTSEWTLDYPPLFAWLEFILSQIAKYFDPKMLVVKNLNYASTHTIIFQRLSVIITDWLFIYSVLQYVSYYKKKKSRGSSSSSLLLTVFLLGNSGLLLVDHIHFQYNGFLFGLLLLSILRICQGRVLEGSFWFSALLNFKHIYLYMAPAYFVYLLRNYCFSSHKDGRLNLRSFSLRRLVTLGLVVVSVFLLSFGPFIALNQMPQVLSRLFPFKRGLCHAYWAPNAWALYNVADKGMTVAGLKYGLLEKSNLSHASMTGGLVQEQEHTVLPSISPIVTLVMTVISQLPVLLHIWLYATGARGFLRALVLCAYGAFMFGWHVHEKAVLLMIIPLTLLAVEKKKDAQVFLLLSTVGHVSLFPLIFTPQETLIKYIIVGIYAVLAFPYLGAHYQEKKPAYRLPLLSVAESAYVLGLVVVELYCQFLHGALGLSEKLPFLPLLLTSVYCAVGLTYTWAKFYLYTWKDKTVDIALKHD